MSLAADRIWWIYMLRRRDGALYTGITTDVAQRLRLHASGKGAKALRGKGPLTLVWRRRVGAQGLALRLEWHIKRLTHTEKEQLARRRGSLAALRQRFGCSKPTRLREARDCRPDKRCAQR